MKICLLGHPFAPIGMGEQIASFSASMNEVYLDHYIYDIYKMLPHDNRPWLSRSITEELNDYDVRIFHINGDEVEGVLANLETNGFTMSAAYNIIVPAWELPNYPEVWRDSINKFDEVWAISNYVKNMFEGWPSAVVRYCGQSCERRQGLVYPRKYFGINASSFVLLAFFDQSSYFSRKNPDAVIRMFKELRGAYPYGDFQLVVKAKNQEISSDFAVDEYDQDIIYINENLAYDETTSLIDCCDVYVSLHRAEGFGRGAAEAVLRNRRAIITGYSGVEDFSHDRAISAVGYRMVDVKEGEYPYHDYQQWAEPDINKALVFASKLYEMHESGKSVQEFFDRTPEAGIIVREVASNLAVGINIINNLESIREARSSR